MLLASVLAAPQSPPGVTESVLETGKVFDRSLVGAETHSYRIETSEANLYCSLIVDQRGIDIVLAVFNSDGKKLAEVDNFNGATGPERLNIVLDRPAPYRVEVRSFGKNASGQYGIRLVALRPVANADFTRIAAERAFDEAELLRTAPSVQSRRNATAKYQEALKGFATIKDREGEADSFTSLGRNLADLSETQPALEAFLQALDRKRSLGDRKAEALLLHNIGGAYYSLSEYSKALDYSHQSLAMHQSLGNRAGEGTALHWLGIIYAAMDDNEKALDYFNKCLAAWQDVRDVVSQSVVLHNIGSLYDKLNEYSKALGCLNRAMELSSAAKDKRGQAVGAHLMARVYKSMGQIQTSLDYLNQALAIYKVTGPPRMEALILIDIGKTYLGLGEPALSLDNFQRGYTMLQPTGDKSDEAACLQQIGSAYNALGDYKNALEYYTKGLAIFKSLGNRRGEAWAQHDLGLLSERQGNRQAALDHNQQSLSLLREIHDRGGESSTLHNQGRLYEQLGDRAKALAHLEQALAIARELGARGDEAWILYDLAVVERNRNNLAGARAILELAIQLIEGIRTNLTSQALRTSYFASLEKVYRLYTEVLMKMGQTVPAFQAAERRRARSLLDSLTEAHSGIRRGVDAALLAKESEIQQSLNEKEQRRMRLMAAKENPERLATVNQEIRSLSAEYETVRAQIRAKSPRFASLTEPQPISLTEIQKQILDNDTLLLEYSLGEDVSYAWLISASGISSFTLPKRAEIEAAAKKTHEWLASSNRTPQPEAMASLAKIVLAPLAAELGNHRLLIVADGALEFVPFAALPDPNSPSQPMAVNHELVSLPSASTLVLLRKDGINKPAPPKTLALLADPVFSGDDSRVPRAQGSTQTSPSRVPLQLQRALSDTGIAGSRIARLPGTRREAAAIRALLPAAGYRESLDFEASRETLTGAVVAEAGIVHLATHGLLNTVHPELSGLVLSLVDREGKSVDGFLRLHEIYNLELKAGLVVLSACQTGLGKEVRGEGLIGLTRGFMYAGAPRVMASLWKVDDRATSELMTHFYKALMGVEHRTPAAALRAAQVEMWKSKTWTDPYYWAAFSLQGEWN